MNVGKGVLDGLTTYVADLKVRARGYWFSAGGAKGSFGFYPHLKDSHNCPVYPDTQVHGNLKMTAQWLVNLGIVAQEDVTMLFGSGGGDEKNKDSVPSRLFITDLVLDEQSRKKWRSSRFEVKPRIKIDEDNRTVEEHFLVYLEMANLEGLTLNAKLYLHIPESQKSAAEELLKNILPMVGAMGAFRSRGCGRGVFELSDFRKIEINNTPSVEVDKAYRFSLISLVNMRNKPIDPGSAQVIDTATVISKDQIMAWLAKTYWSHYGAWPAPQEMSSIEISNLYPSPAVGLLTKPCSMSTLKDEAGQIREVWGEDHNKSDEGENFFRGKVKSIGSEHVMTEDGQVWPVEVHRRFRNNIDDDFVTTTNGLFMQEYILRDSIFTGVLTIKNQSDFTEKAVKLLTNSILNINGTLLQPIIGSSCPIYGAVDNKPYLVDNFLPFILKEHFVPDNFITITTNRKYNTILKRPSRQHIVIMPGSLLMKGSFIIKGDTPWISFVKKNLQLRDKNVKNIITESIQDDKKTSYKIKNIYSEITRAQLGLLRTMLHPVLTEDIIKKQLQHRIEKYNTRGHVEELRNMLQELYEVIKKYGLQTFRNSLQDLIIQIQLQKWETKHKNQKAGGL